MKNWTETKFAVDPISLLRLQYIINKRESMNPNIVGIHSWYENRETGISPYGLWQ